MWYVSLFPIVVVIVYFIFSVVYLIIQSSHGFIYFVFYERKGILLSANNYISVET